MKSIRFMDAAAVKAALTMDKTIEWMEQVYRLYSRGEADVFPIITHEFDGMMRNMDIKSGHLDGADLVGVKMLIRVRDNPEKRGLPNLTGLVLVSDSKTGQPLGVLDGLSITNMRTAAAGGLAARIFAREDAQNALIVGAGYQGRVQALALIEVLPNLKRISITDSSVSKAEELAVGLQVDHPSISFSSCVMESLERELATCDVLVTCTPAKEAFIQKDWIKPGTHINAIGADTQGKNELDPTLVASAKLFADSIKQVTVLGESQHAFAQGLITVDDITEIGDVLEGTSPGRTAADEITIFDATGMAIQDLIVGGMLLRDA